MSKLKCQLLFVLFTLCIASLNAQPDAATSTTTPATTSLKVSSITGYTVGSARDTLSKRGVQVADLTQSAASGKSYDPPPEFYRGPGSTSSSSGSNYNNRDNQVTGINVKPLAFPDTNERNNYAQDSNNYLTTTFSNWKQQLKGGYGGVGGNGRPPVQDRISVGHYGSADHGGGGGGNAIGYNYGYEGRPYATAPGGSSGGGVGHQLDYNPHAAHYGTSAHGGGYSADDHHADNNLYYNSDESIPFDLYNNNNNYNKGQYAGAGGEYSYTQYSSGHEQEHAAHKGHPDLPQKSLLVKSFLIPLASAAVLGIAAALVSNPLLLQLGTVSGVAPALVGKRKRRSADVARLTPVAEPESLQQRKALWLAYRGQHGQNQELS